MEEVIHETVRVGGPRWWGKKAELYVFVCLFVQPLFYAH